MNEPQQRLTAPVKTKDGVELLVTVSYKIISRVDLVILQTDQPPITISFGFEVVNTIKRTVREAIGERYRLIRNRERFQASEPPQKLLVLEVPTEAITRHPEICGVHVGDWQKTRVFSGIHFGNAVFVPQLPDVLN